MEPPITILKSFLSKEIADSYFADLLENINWTDTLLNVEGKEVKIKRKMAYAYDKIVDYKYANLKFIGSLWNDTLSSIRDSINNHLNDNYNSVLLNLYSNGKELINWHTDKEDVLGDINESVIVTVNLGATRTFWFMDIVNGDKHSYKVENGDILIMEKGCQATHLHAILPEKEVTEPRISLTYRKVKIDHEPSSI